MILDSLLTLFHQKKFLSLKDPAEFASIDIEKSVGITTTNERLYLAGETNSDIPPDHIVGGYRIGAKTDDELYLLIADGGSSTEFHSRIVMPNSQSSSEKATNRSEKCCWYQQHYK